MGKYKTSRECIHAVNNSSSSVELRSVLEKYYPDAFIKWDSCVFKIGDTIQRGPIVVGAAKPTYLLVKTSDGKAQLLSLQKNGPTLWKNISTDMVNSFGDVTLKMFHEITKGMSHKVFKKVVKKK